MKIKFSNIDVQSGFGLVYDLKIYIIEISVKWGKKGNLKEQGI